ncbi:MAG: DeoR/GlpR transcriptional regulator [Thermomicrobiales bacterium]|nr:DeoR/GlpR transcriptional regulator [Thermomicrobiales bacterium]
MLPAERHQRILDVLRARRSASIAELADALETSASTINRDLSVLAAEGWLRRVRGGASIATGLSADPPAKLERLRNVREKEAIGAAAAALVQPGQVVFLEASTTVRYVARNLKQVRPLTAVTNDIFIAADLADLPEIETIVTGGLLRRATRALVGPLIEHVLDTIHVDVVFTGVSGLHVQHGLSTGNMLEAQTKQRLLKAGDQIVGVADHTKFNRIAFSRLGPVTALDVLVTDELAPADDVERIREMGVTVVIATLNDAPSADGNRDEV